MYGNSISERALIHNAHEGYGMHLDTGKLQRFVRQSSKVSSLAHGWSVHLSCTQSLLTTICACRAMPLARVEAWAQYGWSGGHHTWACKNLDPPEPGVLCSARATRRCHRRPGCRAFGFVWCTCHMGNLFASHRLATGKKYTATSFSLS